MYKLDVLYIIKSLKFIFPRLFIKTHATEEGYKKNPRETYKEKQVS